MAIAIKYTGILANGSSFAAGSGSGQFDTTKDEIIVDGYLTLSANYGTASSHGDTLDFTSVAPPVGASMFGSAPNRMDVFEAPVAGSAALGYQYIYCPGPTLAAPTQAGGVLQILGTGAASGQGGTEITEASAYSSFTPSLDAAVLRFRAWFTRL